MTKPSGYSAPMPDINPKSHDYREYREAVRELCAQFGSDYGRIRAFKAAFLAELHKVLTVYPSADAEPTSAGLIVKPSLTHIPRRTLA